MPKTIAVINRNVLVQVNQDSGSLTSATTVVHKFSDGDVGEFKGLLLNARGDSIAQFGIGVGASDQAGSTPEQEELPKGRRLPSKVEVDLTSLHMPGRASASMIDDCGCCGGNDYEGESSAGGLNVAAGGYVVFRVPAGAVGGYAVELYKPGQSGRGEKVFDSRALGTSDLLAVVLLRPGTYSVTGSDNGAKAELKVAYPEHIPRVLEATKVAFTKDGILPDSIRVFPTQGVIFSFEVPSRVKIDLVKPEDRLRPTRVGKSSASPKSPAIQKKRSRRLQLFPRPPIAGSSGPENRRTS